MFKNFLFLFLFANNLFAKEVFPFSDWNYPFAISVSVISFILLLWLFIIMRNISRFSYFMGNIFIKPDLIFLYFKSNEKNKNISNILNDYRINKKFHYYLVINYNYEVFSCKQIYMDKIKEYYQELLNNEKFDFEVYILKIPRSSFRLNFHCQVSEIFSKINLITAEKTIILGMFLVPIVTTVIYLLWNNYFIKLLELFGFIPSFTYVNVNNLLTNLFLNIYLLGIVPFKSFMDSIWLSLLFVFIVICIIYFILKKYLNLKKFNFSYKLLFSILLSNLIFTLYIIGLLVWVLFSIILSTYKIEYPNNKNIGDFYFLAGDYIEYTRTPYMVKLGDKYYYSMGHDDVLLYYYDIDENKKIMLLNELSTYEDENDRFKNCEIIYSNSHKEYKKYLKKKNEVESRNDLNPREKEKELNEIKDEMERKKLYSLLITNTILNTTLIKKELISNINVYKERSVNWIDDLKVEETIKDCKKLTTFKFTDEQENKIKEANKLNNEGEQRKLLSKVLDEILSEDKNN